MLYFESMVDGSHFRMSRNILAIKCKCVNLLCILSLFFLAKSPFNLSWYTIFLGNIFEIM